MRCRYAFSEYARLRRRAQAPGFAGTFMRHGLGRTRAGARFAGRTRTSLASPVALLRRAAVALLRPAGWAWSECPDYASVRGSRITTAVSRERRAA